jgi:H+/Cl- antiporter ClcA
MLRAALGGLAWLAISIHIGRRRLLLGTAAAAGVAAALGQHVAFVGFLPSLPRSSVLVVRAAVGLFVAVLVATALTKGGRPEPRLPGVDS